MNKIPLLQTCLIKWRNAMSRYVISKWNGGCVNESPNTHTTHLPLPFSRVFKLSPVKQKQYILQLYKLWNFSCSTLCLIYFTGYSEGDVPNNRLAIVHWRTNQLFQVKGKHGYRLQPHHKQFIASAGTLLFNGYVCLICKIRP